MSVEAKQQDQKKRPKSETLLLSRWADPTPTHPAKYRWQNHANYRCVSHPNRDGIGSCHLTRRFWYHRHDSAWKPPMTRTLPLRHPAGVPHWSIRKSTAHRVTPADERPCISMSTLCVWFSFVVPSDPCCVAQVCSSEVVVTGGRQWHLLAVVLAVFRHDVSLMGHQRLESILALRRLDWIESTWRHPVRAQVLIICWGFRDSGNSVIAISGGAISTSCPDKRTFRENLG